MYIFYYEISDVVFHYNELSIAGVVMVYRSKVTLTRKIVKKNRYKVSISLALVKKKSSFSSFYHNDIRGKSDV
jgi:hypothetical protein